MRYLTLLLWLICGSAGAETQFYGYLKNFSYVQAPLPIDGAESQESFVSEFSARAMFNQLEANWSFQLHYEINQSFSSRRAPVLVLPERNAYRLTDIASTVGNEADKHRGLQNLDRLNLRFKLEAGDLTIGRQPITFGSARVINPTDVFLPFNIQALNTEYRVGIDALRFQKPIGALGELDMGLVFSEGSKDDSAVFARLRQHVGGSDLAFTAIRFSQQSLVGLGIERSLGAFGGWVDMAVVRGKAHHFRISAGVDYGFSDAWLGMLELHYNGAGSDDPADYVALADTPAYTNGGVFLFGQSYFMPALSWQINPLTSASLQMIWNLDDHSVFTQLSAEFSLKDNLTLGATAYWFHGAAGTLSSPSGFVSSSEYGSNPDRWIVSLRYYF